MKETTSSADRAHSCSRLCSKSIDILSTWVPGAGPTCTQRTAAIPTTAKTISTTTEGQPTGSSDIARRRAFLMHITMATTR